MIILDKTKEAQLFIPNFECASTMNNHFKLLLNRSLLSVFLLCYSHAAISIDDLAILDPESLSFNEVYKNDVPVSGKVIAGIGMSGMAVNTELTLFPMAIAGQNYACIQVMSRDGRYWAENSFVLPKSNSKGAIKVKYPSKYNDLLNEYGADDLAILSYLGRCQKGKPRSFIVTSRQKLMTSDRSLIVYVNSSRSDTYIRVMNDASKKGNKKCRKITEGRRTGYDTICTIDMSTDELNPNPLKLGIYRRKFNKSLKPELILVSLPKL